MWNKEKYDVVLTVRGGVADWVNKPGISVLLIDFDNLESGACPACNVELDDLTCPECEENWRGRKWKSYNHLLTETIKEEEEGEYAEYEDLFEMARERASCGGWAPPDTAEDYLFWIKDELKTGRAALAGLTFAELLNARAYIGLLEKAITELEDYGHRATLAPWTPEGALYWIGRLAPKSKVILRNWNGVEGTLLTIEEAQELFKEYECPKRLIVVASVAESLSYAKRLGEQAWDLPVLIVLDKQAAKYYNKVITERE